VRVTRRVALKKSLEWINKAEDAEEARAPEWAVAHAALATAWATLGAALREGSVRVGELGPREIPPETIGDD
jgi:hypothetical protein